MFFSLLSKMQKTIKKNTHTHARACAHARTYARKNSMKIKIKKNACNQLLLIVGPPISVHSGKCSTQIVTQPAHRKISYYSVVLTKDTGVIRGLPIDGDQ